MTNANRLWGATPERVAAADRFPDVWCHGDVAEWTENRGILIHGRSGATPNPGGVRIGTAEVCNIVEKMPEIAEAICVGQTWNDDVRVILFVRLTENVSLNDDRKHAIKARVRTGASPRHVPAKIIAVHDIPRTKSGKIVELAVRDVFTAGPYATSKRWQIRRFWLSTTRLKSCPSDDFGSKKLFDITQCICY